MVRAHPYTTWPLHVKLFTEEAVKIWSDASRKSPLPQGLTVLVELEGVDGKSGEIGSGRTGPIDVTDGELIGLCFVDSWLTLSGSAFHHFAYTEGQGSRHLASVTPMRNLQRTNR